MSRQTQIVKGAMVVQKNLTAKLLFAMKLGC